MPPNAPRAVAVRTAVLAACAVAVLVPFAVARLPPSIDLPQHVAQIRLARDALHDPASAWLIQWGAPNTLVYAIVAMAWATLPVLDVGRATLAVLALASFATTALLARSRQRPAAPLALATVLVFHHGLYWGFLNFLAGWPFFALWLATTPAARDDESWRRVWLRAAVAVGLYFGHVLWLLVAAVWALVAWGVARDGLRGLARRLFPLVPALAAAAWWSFHIAAFRRASGLAMGTVYFDLPWARLSPAWLADASLGGVSGVIEAIALAAIVAWLIAGALSARRGPQRVDRTYALAAALLAAIVLFAPDRALDTLALASRFAPFALTLAILAVPPPTWRAQLLDAAAGVVLAGFIATTTFAWRMFDRVDLAGLENALAHVPAGSRTVGVDYVRTSRYVRDEPFLQDFAYAQVVAGGSLAFSFAQHGTGLVRVRQPSRLWTEGALTGSTKSFPTRVLSGFDVVIVAAPPATHAALARDGRVEPMTAEGTWRLYRVVQ